jgi:hypothetical protein
VSLTDPTLADPITPQDAWKAAAVRQTPFGQYLGEKLLGGIEAMRPVAAAEEAMLPGRLHGDMATVLGAGTDEYGRQSPGMGRVGPDEGQPMMSKADWEASPSYRPSLAWDEGMTPARAEALATQHDRLEWNQSLIERYQGGLMGQAAGFVAGLAPGIADPTNYVPLLGPAAKAAMVARLGVIGGNAALHGAEAAANTALFEPLAAEHARTFGQPFGWQDAAADIALGALAGAAGGAIHGGLEYRGSLREAATRTRLDTVLAAADATSLAAEQNARGLPVDVAPILAGRLPEAPRPAPFDVGGIVPRRAGEAPIVRDTSVPSTAPEPAPLRLYHGTTAPLFERFGETSDIGFHFTDDPATAGEFASGREGGLSRRGGGAGSESAAGRIIAADVGITNPLRMADLGLWKPRDVARELERVGAADPGFAEAMRKEALTRAHDLKTNTVRAEEAKLIAEHLQSRGYDGIVYKNEKEGTAGKDSYIAFKPEQVRIVAPDFRPSFATAAPEPPHPSVAEAARRVGKAEADPLATFKADAGLEGYQAPLPGHEPKPEPVPGEPAKPAKPERPPTREEKAAALAALPRELAEIEAMRREGSFTPGDEATLAAGEAEAQRAESYAAAWQTLAACVARNAA